MSDINNNIPTRITQLEEATEYEDGMFFAVAKAGRGTYKIPVDEMTPNEQALSDKMENEIVPAVENSFAYGTVDESEIATFTDGSDLPMPKLEVAIEPVQEGSGDPSPTNIRPISGGSAVDVNVSGKNLFNPSSLTEGKTINSNGSIDNQANRSATVEGIPIQPNSRYTISYAESIRHGVFYYDKDDNFISFLAWGNNPRAFLTPSNAYYVRFSFEDGTVPTNVMLSIGETTQTYTAYNGHTYTIDLGGTRYGGKLDVVSGVLTVDRAYVDLGTLSWGKTSLEATILFNAISDKKEMSPMMCSKYQYARDKGFGLDFGTISDSSNTSYIDYIFVRNQDFSGKTTTECASILNGTQLVYELATPTTIQLTPTQVKSLKGYNNISADTGNILKVEYIRDLDIVINSLLERIAALEG